MSSALKILQLFEAGYKVLQIAMALFSPESIIRTYGACSNSWLLQSYRIMEDSELSDIEISGWWAFATIALVIAGGATLVARMIGPDAIEMLIKGSLITIFMVGGILVGLLGTQAIGASQLWGLGIAETESAQRDKLGSPHGNSASTTEFVDESFADDEDIDPFYEIMRQNRSGRSAARPPAF